MSEKTPKTVEQIQAELSAPFTKIVGGKSYPDLKWLPKQAVSNNTKFICVPYLSGNQIKDRLNEVFGLTGWQFSSQLEADKTRTGTLSVLIDGDWISRDGTGTQSNQEKEKGAETDALKRAARNFGIGAYLDQLQSKFIPAKVGGNGKAAPADNSGRMLYGGQVSDFINGMSIGQGLIVPLLSEFPSLFQRPEIKLLWSELQSYVEPKKAE